MKKDIFEDKLLYPLEDGPVLAHFSGYFDKVYIAFLPFFTLDGDNGTYERASSKIISFEEACEKNPIYKKLDDDFNGVIYSANEAYPPVEEIYRGGRIVPWKHILNETGLAHPGTLHLALMTSIGALRKEFELPEQLDKLNAYTEKEKVYHPSEGGFDALTKRRIFQLLKAHGYEDVIVTDEFYEETQQLKLSVCGEAGFVDRIGYKDYYIYPLDKSCLFTISWDYFFFFVVISSRIISPKAIEANFEGFWASEKDSHLWYH